MRKMSQKVSSFESANADFELSTFSFWQLLNVHSRLPRSREESQRNAWPPCGSHFDFGVLHAIWNVDVNSLLLTSKFVQLNSVLFGVIIYSKFVIFLQGINTKLANCWFPRSLRILEYAYSQAGSSWRELIRRKDQPRASWWHASRRWILWSA